MDHYIKPLAHKFEDQSFHIQNTHKTKQPPSHSGSKDRTDLGSWEAILD